MHEYGALSTCAIRYLLHVLLRWGFPALTKQPARWPRSLCTKLSLRSISLSFQRQHRPRLFLGIILTDDWPDQLRKGSLTGDQRAAVPYHDLDVWCSHSGEHWTSSAQRHPGSRSSHVWGMAATGTPGIPWAGPQRAACSPSHWMLKKHGKHKDVLKHVSLI